MDILEILPLVLKTLFSYFFLLIILKIMGKRELSQISIFDVVIFLIMSELFSLAINNTNDSLLHFIIPISIIVILEITTAFLSLKSLKIRQFFEGKMSFIIFKGKINVKEMKKNRYNVSDLMLQLRNKEYQSPSEIEYAILEGNGILNIIAKKDVIVEYPDPLIIDGKINQEALKKLGKDEVFIYCEISKYGYSSIEKIFFCQWLKDGMFIVPMEK